MISFKLLLALLLILHMTIPDLEMIVVRLFQCDVTHQWIEQRQVDPVSVYCDGVGCYVSCPRHGVPSSVVAHWSKYHCYKQALSRYDLSPNKQTSKQEINSNPTVVISTHHWKELRNILFDAFFCLYNSLLLLLLLLLLMFRFLVDVLLVFSLYISWFALWFYMVLSGIHVN